MNNSGYRIEKVLFASVGMFFIYVKSSKRKDQISMRVMRKIGCPTVRVKGMQEKLSKVYY